MREAFNTDHVTEKFKSSKHFAAYEKAVDAYNDLPWEKAKEPEVAKNLAGLAAVFAVEFAQNTNGMLQHFSRRNNRRPAPQEAVFHDVLELNREELAGGIHSDGSGREPHSMLAIEAAHEVGVDVTGEIGRAHV